MNMVKYKATQHPGVEIVDPSESNFNQACGMLGFDPALIRQLQGCLHDLIECAPRLRRCEPQLSRFEQQCKTIEKLPQMCGRLEELVQTCNGYEKMLKNACCPGQNLYGPVTIDRYSSVTTVDIDTIVAALGDPYVDQYPVPTAKKIRMEQDARPGYCPEEIEVDLSLSNNATNYLMVKIQFFVGDEKIGPEYKGSHFLDKDGTIKKIKFPLYRDHVVVIGTAEKLAVEIEMTGPNSIEFASVTTHVNAAGWYQVCAT